MEKQKSIEKEEAPILSEKNEANKRASKKRIALLKEYRKHAVNNEIEIVGSDKCGCFFCRHVYDARLVQDWLDDERGVSAICPECGIDAVIGDASGIPVDKPLMKEMNKLFYGEDVMENNPGAARKYILRYTEGKIAHKKKTEGLYLHYLRTLEEKENDRVSSLVLGDAYRYGLEFTEPDHEEALRHYEMPYLKADAYALNNVGMMLLERMEEASDSKRAYECFAKSSALHSLEGALRLGQCYIRGLGIKPDPEVGFQIVNFGIDAMYRNFVIERDNWLNFPEYCLTLAECYEKGLGTVPSDENAFRYYLLGEFAHGMRIVYEGVDHNPSTINEIKKGLFRLGKRYGLERSEPVFDSDSFGDSLDDICYDGRLKKLDNVGFDEEDHVLEFDIIFDAPHIFIDIGSLYCGLIQGRVHFRFEGVASCKLSTHTSFTDVIGSDDGYRFIDENEGDDAPEVAEINFVPDPVSFKSRK